MLSKKYTQDYVLEYDEERGGKLKARAVYKGKYYIFIFPEAIVRRTAICFSLLAAVSWCAFLVPMFLQSGAARTLYVMIPHACVFLPLVYISAVTFDLWTAKPPLTRRQSDNISKRAAQMPFILLLFSGLAMLGFLILALLRPSSLRLPGDPVFGLCEALLFAAAFLLFKNKKYAETQEADIT